MVWQDYVFLIGGILQVPPLFSSLLNKRTQYPGLSSLQIASILSAFTITFLSLGLYLAAIGTCASAALWFLLLVFRPVRSTVDINPRVLPMLNISFSSLVSGVVDVSRQQGGQSRRQVLETVLDITSGRHHHVGSRDRDPQGLVVE